MLAMFDGLLANDSTPRIRRWLAPALLLASTAAPGASGLLAKDKPAPAGAEKVAVKIDDSTRQGNEALGNHALLSTLEAARNSRDAAARLPGYSATFVKQEQIGKSTIRQTMQVKFRRDPFSVYMKFVQPSPGREVLYVEGRNKGKLLVHEASGIVSWAGTLSFSPTSDDVMKENRYPITSFGIEKLVDVIIRQWEGELKHPETEVVTYPNAKVGNVECRLFEVTHPRSAPHFKFKTTRLYIDRNSGLPIRVEQFGFPTRPGETPPLIEEYTYTDIKTEINLADLDFDVKNNTYGFK